MPNLPEVHKAIDAPMVINQQPRPKRSGYVGSVRNRLYAGLIPTHIKHSVIPDALKGGVLNPPANKDLNLQEKNPPRYFNSLSNLFMIRFLL